MNETPTDIDGKIDSLSLEFEGRAAKGYCTRETKVEVLTLIEQLKHSNRLQTLHRLREAWQLPERQTQRWAMELQFMPPVSLVPVSSERQATFDLVERLYQRRGRPSVQLKATVVLLMREQAPRTTERLALMGISSRLATKWMQEYEKTSRFQLLKWSRFVQ